ncbi:MAG: PadR family transcriptional regulator [Actinomycetes bacterium]
MRTLDYAVLGLLARRPGTGYEVSARLRQPVGFYWTESHGGVYPSLHRLMAAGLVTVQTRPGPGPHDKKVYSATARGVTELGAWAAQPPEDPPPRDELLLKVSSLWAADRAAALAMLRAERDRWEAQRREYADIVAGLEAAQPTVGDAQWFGLQTARRGVAFARGRRDWCRRLVADLREPRDPDDGPE